MLTKIKAATGALLIPAVLILALALDVRGGAPFWPPERPFPPGWLGGVIPYVLDDDMSGWARESAQQAMSAWTGATVLRFVPRTNETDFIYFVEAGQYQKCVRQPTCIGAGGFAPNIQHGVGHGLGLMHEQQRRDRDRYVRVFQGPISPHLRSVWNPQPIHGADISPYNYQSVMHYGFLSSKRNRRGGPRALETIPPHMPVGQLGYSGPGGRITSITPGDADTVARLVGLTPTSWTVSTNPLGLTVIVDGEEVTTPAVFDWAPGSEHTLSVPSPQAQPGSRYRFGRWSDDDGAGAHTLIGGTRTVVATSDTTLYEANFVAAHRVSTRVRPEGAGAVTISPASPDGYYPLRSEITMSAEPTAGSGFRFVRWEIRTDYLWRNPRTHGLSANPAHTYALPSLEYTAVFTQGPMLRVKSNADPTTITIDGNEDPYYTPVALEADSLPARVTVAQVEDWWQHDIGYRDRFRRWSDGGDESHAVNVSRTEDTLLELTVDTEHRLVTEVRPDWREYSVVATPRSEDGFYPEGTEVRLLASAGPRAQFVGWNGDVAGRNPEAVVVMDEGRLAEAVFAVDATELQLGAPVEVSLGWDAGDREVGKMYWVPVPPGAGELDIQFSTRTASPGAEAGLFVEPWQMFANWVVHENAHRVLRAGEVETLTIPRPPDRWPVAYFILVRAAESTGSASRNLEGTLVARVRRGGDVNRAPQAVGKLEDRTLTTDGGPLVLDVARAFRDPDGDALTYGATSSSPGVAAVSVWNRTVTVTPVAIGTATVTVTAADPGGLSARQSFTVTVRGAAAAFTDDPIVPGVTPVKAVHFEELRARIDVLRGEVGLSRFRWTDPVLRARATRVRFVHLLELREALAEAYAAAGRSAPSWTDAAPGVERTAIKAVHLMELRAAVRVLE